LGNAKFWYLLIFELGQWGMFEGGSFWWKQRLWEVRCIRADQFQTHWFRLRKHSDARSALHRNADWLVRLTILLSDHTLTFDYKFNLKAAVKCLTLLKWNCSSLINQPLSGNYCLRVQVCELQCSFCLARGRPVKTQGLTQARYISLPEGILQICGHHRLVTAGPPNKSFNIPNQSYRHPRKGRR
jgi:hypothetical protein